MPALAPIDLVHQMTSGATPVSSIGESGLLARLFESLPQAPRGQTWSGDDAAVIEISGVRCLFATDAVVEHVDFDLAWATGADVGWKAVAVNASDIAAMGGRPTHAVATLSLTPEHDLETVDGVMSGLIEAAATYDVALVGGDITEAKDLAVSVAMVGELDGDEPVLRSGARTGDAICVTGALGGARAGYLLLTEGAPDTDDAAVAHCIERQLRPRARVDAGVVIARVASAMIDLSDGLARDLQRVVVASDTGCEIDLEALPIDPSVAAADPDPLRAATVGGEDFELLFTCAPEDVDRVCRELEEIDVPVTRIGTVIEGARRMGDRDLREWVEGSWDHLRRR